MRRDADPGGSKGADGTMMWTVVVNPICGRDRKSVITSMRMSFSTPELVWARSIGEPRRPKSNSGIYALVLVWANGKVGLRREKQEGDKKIVLARAARRLDRRLRTESERPARTRYQRGAGHAPGAFVSTFRASRPMASLRLRSPSNPSCEGLCRFSGAAGTRWRANQ